MVRTLYVVYLAVFSCVLAGKTHSDHFVHCCCLSLWKQVNIWLYLPRALMDFNQSWIRCNLGTLICWCSQRSHIKVKGHLRSSCKIGWKCESGLTWKVESDWNQTWFIDIMGTFTDIHAVKGHISRSKVIWGQVRQAENVNMASFVKLEVRFEQTWFVDIIREPSYVHVVKRSQIKVKGHLRSTCKITWKCKFGLICILEDKLELWYPNRCGD